MSFRICIIGCGEHVFKAHGPSLEKYARLNPGVELGGCCDIDLTRAEAFRRTFEFARAYTNWEEMIDRESPDALSLALPPQVSCRVVLDLLKSGIPVMIEKPPGLTSHELERLIDAAHLHKTPTQVAFNRRFTPLLARAHHLLEEHFPPESVFQINYEMIRFNRFDLDFSTTAIHALDTVLFLARSPYRNAVFHYQDRRDTGRPVSRATMDGQCECGALVHLNFQPTAGVVLERASIHARDQTLTVDLPMWGGYDAPGRLCHWRNDVLKLELSGNDLAIGEQMFEQSGFYAENEAFFNAVRHGRQPSPGLAEARQQVALMEAFRKRVRAVDLREGSAAVCRAEL